MDLIEFPSMKPLRFRQFEPAPELRALVQCYWTVGSRAAGSAGQAYEELIYPDGGASIIFSYDENLAFDGERLKPGAVAESQVTRVSRFGLHTRSQLLGIRFHPGGMHALFGISAREVCDRLLPVSDLAPGAAALYEHIGAIAAAAAQVACVDRWLRRLNGRRHGMSPVVAYTQQMIAHAHGCISPAALALAAGLSQRQLERLYREEIGISPKSLCRLNRIAHARALLERETGSTLAHVGAASGYYDQAHFAHDFKAIAGMTPRTYRALARANSRDKPMKPMRSA